MDTFRGFDDSASGGSDDYFRYDDDDEMEVPPSFGDERRMQVRAYNFWTGLLGEGTFPSIEDLEPEEIDDFRDNSVLLDFTSGIDDPAIVYLGTQLRRECEIEGEIGHISEVPSRSLLSRITDHYLQIIANRAPVGFEAEFVNQRGHTIMYRGILLPFSSDDDSIDFIYGVINWKEAVPDQLDRELQLELSQSLGRLYEAPPAAVEGWADGPSSPELEAPVADSFSFDADEKAAPSHGLPEDESDLARWLSAARECAASARSAEARGRTALYEAIGRAYDFSLIAERQPDDYKILLDEAGITVQERAPMTPVVKLVFGSDYDKTRLTEFATALGFAHRTGVALGDLPSLLSDHEGGLKAIVAEERALRRKDAPTSPSSHRPAPARLKSAMARELDSFREVEGDFVILVARREDDGKLSLIGSVDDEKLRERALRKVVTD